MSYIDKGHEDGLQNYDVHSEIGRGSNSVVYLATCKRGRLRNRQVALKKIPKQSDALRDDAAQPRPTPSAILHQSLFHPSIMSLFATFSTPSATYHVMELCPNSTLHDFLHSRQPPVLSEAELRGVLKSLVGALAYLHKQSIICRDLNPNAIVLGEDYRVKLAKLEHAVRAETTGSTLQSFYGPSNYVSPEIVEHQTYSFATDLWSLGGLAVTCLSGKPVFEAQEESQIMANISRCKFDLPDTVSYEARDLINGLLQGDPNHRIPLHRILSHPFFNPSLLVLDLFPTSKPVTQRIAKPLSDSDEESHAPRFKPRGSDSYPLRKQPTSNESAAKAGRRVFSDPTATSRLISKAGHSHARSVSSYASLRIEDARLSANKAWSRFVAEGPELDPSSATSGTPALTADSVLSDSESATSALDDDLDAESDYAQSPHVDGFYRNPKKTLDDKPLVEYLAAHPLLLPPKARSNTMSVESPHLDTASHARRGYDVCSDAQTQDLGGYSNVRETRSSGRGVNRAEGPHGPNRGLVPLNTSYLTPKTHKLSDGNITILPSKSLLVDFREGERRKGRKGDQVFVVSADGGTVKAYDAPHLSTPCCLIEAVAEHSFPDLPQALTRQYSEAVKVVDHLKQKIPKLILNEDDAQYTLMANEPLGDVEIILSPLAEPSSSSGHQRSKTRIRLLRTHRTIEISRSLTSASGKVKAAGEWTKRIIPTIGHGYKTRVPAEEADRLDEQDREGLVKLYRFLRICEAMETAAHPNYVAHQTGTYPDARDDRELPDSVGERTLHAGFNGSFEDLGASVSPAQPDEKIQRASSAGSNPLGFLRVVPRPPKLPNTSASWCSHLANIGDSKRTWSTEASLKWTKEF